MPSRFLLVKSYTLNRFLQGTNCSLFQAFRSVYNKYYYFPAEMSFLVKAMNCKTFAHFNLKDLQHGHQLVQCRNEYTRNRNGVDTIRTTGREEKEGSCPSELLIRRGTSHWSQPRKALSCWSIRLDLDAWQVRPEFPFFVSSGFLSPPPGSLPTSLSAPPIWCGLAPRIRFYFIPLYCIYLFISSGENYCSRPEIFSTLLPSSDVSKVKIYEESSFLLLREIQNP